MPVRTSFAVLAVCLAASLLSPTSAHAGSCADQSVTTCDDGSSCITAADCPQQVDCTSNCFRGNGNASSECAVEILGARLNDPPDDAPGEPSRKKAIRCTDGDPCDADGRIDNRCSFDLSACFANAEAGGACSLSSPVSAFSVANKSGDARLAELQRLGRLVLPAAGPVCSESMRIEVPVRTSRCTSFKDGKLKLALTAAAGDLVDKDKLKIACLPAASSACSSIRGHVTDTVGRALAGAMVSVGSSGTETIVDGGFELPIVESGAIVVRASKEGYLPSMARVLVDSGGQASADIALMAAPVPFMVDASVGGTAADPRGTAVTLPADAFVDSKGAPLGPNESVAITVVPIDPSTREINAFPGSFDATGENGEAEILETITLAELSATRDGEPLQLADGKTALLELVIPASAINPATHAPFAEGDTTPMYWLNPATGVWERDGTGTAAPCSTRAERLCVHASVSHFSWWNADNPIEVTCLRGRVVDEHGAAVPQASMTSIGVDYMSNVHGQSDGAGQYCVHARVASTVKAKAETTSFSLAYESESAPLATPTEPGSCAEPSSCAVVPDLVLPLELTCISGRVTLADGSPVSGATVKSRNSALAVTASDGTFCAAGVPNLEMSLAAVKGSLTGSATVVSGDSISSCGGPGCTNAGDIVISGNPCPNDGSLTGTWQAVPSPDTFPIVERTPGFPRMILVLPTSLPTVLELPFRRVGTTLTFPENVAAAAYLQDCDTIILESEDGRRQLLASTTTAACGDLRLDASEQCDDGDSDEADGCARVICNAYARTSGPGVRWQCDRCVARTPGCGNEMPDAGEECDDGNIGGYDLCEPDCTLPVCGNGLLDRCEGATTLNECTDVEECDDGAGNSAIIADACRPDCRRAFCGDGVVDTGESCDDGNASSGDGCAGCQVE